MMTSRCKASSDEDSSDSEDDSHSRPVSIVAPSNESTASAGMSGGAGTVEDSGIASQSQSSLAEAFNSDSVSDAAAAAATGEGAAAKPASSSASQPSKRSARQAFVARLHAYDASSL